MSTVADVVSLGLLKPRTRLIASIEAIDAVGVPTAAQWLVRHKVSDLVRNRCAELRGVVNSRAAGLLGDLCDEISSIRRPADSRAGTSATTLQRIKDANPTAPVRLMKGLACRTWYPEPALRTIGDLDLWVPTIDDAWRLASSIIDLGYRFAYDEFPWIKANQEHSLYGQIRLVAKDRGLVSIDIHAGPYSVRFAGQLDIGHDGADRWTTLADEDSICTALANAAGDCFIDAKVLNDTALGLGRPDVDWRNVLDRLDRAGLRSFGLTVINVVEELCDLNRVQTDAARRFKQSSNEIEPEPLQVAGEVDPSVRCELVVAHTATVAARDLNLSCSEARRVCAAAREVYTTPAVLRLGARDAEHRMPELNPWTCVRLVPLQFARDRLAKQRAYYESPRVESEEQLSAELALIRCATADFVSALGIYYIPTVDYVLPSNSLATPAK